MLIPKHVATVKRMFSLSPSGRKGDDKIANLLAGNGRLRCECGSSVKFIRGSRPHVKCEKSIPGGGCQAPWFNDERLQEELLSVLLFDSDDLHAPAPDPDEPDRRPMLRAEIENRKTKRKRLMTYIEDNDTLDDDIDERLNLLEREIAERKAAIRKFDAAAPLVPDEAAEKNLLLFFEHYDAVHDGAAPEVLYDIRTRLQEALRTAISSVTLMLGHWYREGGDEPMLCFEVRLRQAPDNALQLCATRRGGGNKVSAAKVDCRRDPSATSQPSIRSRKAVVQTVG